MKPRVLSDLSPKELADYLTNVEGRVMNRKITVSFVVATKLPFDEQMDILENKIKEMFPDMMIISVINDPIKSDVH